MECVLLVFLLQTGKLIAATVRKRRRRNGFPKLLNVAGVLMMSTLVSRVQRLSIHDLPPVVVFLLRFFLWELADVGTG